MILATEDRRRADDPIAPAPRPCAAAPGNGQHAARPPPETQMDAGIPDPEYKAVMYSVVWMKAVKALQEAMAKIETLETKVTALENA